jgi:DNA-binding transcriptional regulator YhcF (GntR family)
MSDVIMLSVRELATKLCVNPETVRRWIRSGELLTELRKKN